MRDGVVRYLGLMFFVANPLCCSQIVTDNGNGMISHHDSKQQLNQIDEAMQQVSVNILQLIAREEINPPLGESRHDPNRDIGFVSLFISLANRQVTDQSVKILNIEIFNVTNNEIEYFDFLPQDIDLRPLENSIIDIHTQRKSGYVIGISVKAVITYQIEEQTYVVESQPVEIERY